MRRRSTLLATSLIAAVLTACALGALLAPSGQRMATASAQPSVASPSPEFLSAALADQERAAGASLELDYTWEWFSGSAGSGLSKGEERSGHYVRTPDMFLVQIREDTGRTVSTSYDRQTGEFRRLEQIGKELLGETGTGSPAVPPSAMLLPTRDTPCLDRSVCPCARPERGTTVDPGRAQGRMQRVALAGATLSPKVLSNLRRSHWPCGYAPEQLQYAF